VTILCYHAVDAAWESPLAVSPREFAAQVEWLQRHRRVVGLDTAVAAMDDRGRMPKGMVSLTFDDGFASVHEHAWPVLRSAALPASIFVVSRTLTSHPRPVDWVDDPPPWRLETMTLEQVMELAEAGVLVGSHTVTHPNLPDLSDAECRRELAESRDVLQDSLRRPIEHLAYPRGLNDARIRRIAGLCGYRWAFTLPESREPFDQFGIPRVGIYRSNHVWHLALKTSRTYLRVRGGTAVRGMRRIAAWTRRAGR
jgi:peptidoglycan/xylan/chitin deacetylase (PgdA/CDA1 family)